MAENDPVATLLPWYATGALPEAERAEVEHHLPGCPACRSTLRTLEEWADVAAAADDGEHVHPRLLVEYAERPAALDAETVRRVEERLAGCTTCREAYENLRSVEARLAEVPAAGAPERRGALRSLWEALASTVLHPVPSLAYLLLLLLLPAASMLRGPGPADPLSAVRVVVAEGERATRAGEPVASAPLDLTAREHEIVVLRLDTELREADLGSADLSFRVELEQEGRILWSVPRGPRDFTVAAGRVSLDVALRPGQLEPGVPHRVVLRAVRPGDPLDGQALFRRSVVVRADSPNHP